jgi:serine phosphatase RsbU (regulator of sigma subunit)
MRRNFQIILTLSLVVILLIGFVAFTFLARKFINDEIIKQAKNDNKVIGKQLITLLAQSELKDKSHKTDTTLQYICDKIELPNGGFICAINPEGNMVAAPGLKPGMTMAFPPVLQRFDNSKADILPTSLKQGESFQGYAHFLEEGRRDVVASVPLNDEVRLFVHQNSDIIKQRASEYVRPLLIIGLIITAVAGLFTYFATNRIVNSYESKIEVQNAELKDALHEIKQQQNQIVAKNEELKVQHDQIALKNQEINDSILYAKRIQTATLPKSIIDNSIVAEHFILFKPRDIVSGDFYWYHDVDDYLIIAAVDCTGHGVPGAFMSMIGITFLNEIVVEKQIFEAGEILDRMRKSVINALGQESNLKGSLDGMDMALCVIEKKNRNIHFAGAFNPMICIRNSNLMEFKADRMPVGIHGKMKEHFSTQTTQLENGDAIYLFSDGYADQFGGTKNRKFLNKNFRNLLIEINDLPMTEQKEVLTETLESWQGDTPQVDDILVIGLKIN